MADQRFLAYVLELLEPLGGCSTRAMFGGHGMYRDGAIFGLVLHDRLYLKTDEESKSAFIGAGGVAFEYPGKTRSVQAGYWSPPEQALESSEDLIRWVRLALAAAVRKVAAKSRKRAPARQAAPTKQPKSRSASPRPQGKR